VTSMKAPLRRPFRPLVAAARPGGRPRRVRKACETMRAPRRRPDGSARPALASRRAACPALCARPRSRSTGTSCRRRRL
jgi:hypothetical protein